MKRTERTEILAVAGYDPSGGAGILADVKTAESNRVYAYAVCTGYTFQNTARITHIHWFRTKEIARQIALCYEEAAFEWVKIGIARDREMLSEILAVLKIQNPSVKVVWDPVLRSSSGAPFMEVFTAADLEAILPEVFMVTPNLPEIRSLYPGSDFTDICLQLSEKTIVYLKGGHDEEFPGRDLLFCRGQCHTLLPVPGNVFPKHGSGCVFSSALTANLAKGHSPLEAAARSKRYIEKFLNSDPGLLGWHKIIENA